MRKQLHAASLGVLSHSMAIVDVGGEVLYALFATNDLGEFGIQKGIFPVSEVRCRCIQTSSQLSMHNDISVAADRRCKMGVDGCCKTIVPKSVLRNTSCTKIYC